jgi:hypothetical protein
VDISVARTTTAAGVDVSGRVLSSEGGRGVTNAVVTLTDMHGKVRSAVTGRLGTYSFSDVEVGETYILSVISRSYSFESRVLQLTDSAADLDFVPNGSSRDIRSR